jgi:glutaredoxin
MQTPEKEDDVPMYRHLAALGALTLMAWGSLPGDASAQQIFKIVAPDGRITFSDRAPADPSVKASEAAVVNMNGAPTNIASLPFELRQAAARYPVTLYTAPGCVTCAQGRAQLTSRGIPFSERTISKPEDADALQRLTGANSVPVLTIGAQQLKGFSDSEWSQFLDAAGYPKTSQLPRSYVPAPASPLVALDQQSPTAAPPATGANPAQPGARPARPAARQEPPPDNPAGIQF